jgi:hypothetical protein
LARHHPNTRTLHDIASLKPRLWPPSALQQCRFIEPVEGFGSRSDGQTPVIDRQRNVMVAAAPDLHPSARRLSATFSMQDPAAWAPLFCLG